MGERRDRDEIERGPSLPTAPSANPTAPAAFPAREPQARSLPDQRDDLRRVVHELEGTLRYMGQAHPQRQSNEQRLSHLRVMLAQIEEAIARGRSAP